MISYTRTGGRAAPGQPADGERLAIDDGSFRLERQSGSPAVGRFGGPLPDGVDHELEQLAAAVGPSAQGEAMPDAAHVEVRTGDAVARFGEGSPPDDRWGALETRLAELTNELVDTPVAAVALDVAPDGRSARLVQQGEEPVEVDLSSGEVHAFLWKGYYEPAGEWRAPLTGPAEAAAPGWSFDLPFDHGLALGPDTTLQVDVTFRLDGALVQAVHAPAIPPPA